MIDRVSNDEKIAELKQLDRNKDRILSQVSHDLRTPLKSIKAFLQQAQSQDANDMEKSLYTDYAINNIELLLYFVNDLLDSAQIKEDKLKLNVEEFSLFNLLNEVHILMNIQAKLQEIKIDINNKIGSEDKMLCNSDQRRIKQVLINLISNSLKHCTPSNSFIQVVVQQKIFNSRKIIEFQIIDNGSGIPPNIITQLSQEYFTFNNKQDQNKYGIGLGLSISKKIISVLGPQQKFFISSKVGQGSKFGFSIYQDLNENTAKKSKMFFKPETEFNEYSTFTLQSQINLNIDESNEKSNVNYNFSKFKQRQQDWPDSPTRPRDSMMNSGDSLNPKKHRSHMIFSQELTNTTPIIDKLLINNILIVDDSVFPRVILKHQLQKLQNNLGYQNIIEAQNGMEALNIFLSFNKSQNTTENIQLIIIDQEMPIMDGISVVEQIKELVETKQYISPKIILNTANNDEQSKTTYNNYIQSKLINSYLSKEINQDILLSTIKQVFK